MNKKELQGQYLTHFSMNGWRQFRDVSLEMHPRITILTGPNGSGKTTLLNILAAQFNWEFPIVSTPQQNKSGALKFITDVLRWRTTDHPSENHTKIGELLYSNGQKATLLSPNQVGAFYTIEFENSQGLWGMYFPAQRPFYVYQSVTNIQTAPPNREQIFNNYSNESKSKLIGNGGRTANFQLKESLLSLAILGAGNEFVQPNEEARDTFIGFQEILRKVLPNELGFEKLKIVSPEISIVTTQGEFSLDAVSGGITSVIDLSWQMFMGMKNGFYNVIVIDEPETHLHPSMQKSLLPNLLDAFPNTQFIVATHSPLIVSSVEDSSVYVLHHINSDRHFSSVLLSEVDKAGTANEILKEAFGVDVTMPIWAEEKIRDVLKEYSVLEKNESSINKLRHKLKELNLEDSALKVISDFLADD